MRSRIDSRVVFLFFCFLFAFLLLEGRVAYLQIYKGEELAVQAVERRMVTLKMGNFYRGDILDREGRSLLDSQVVYRLAVFPSLIRDLPQTVERLSALLPQESRQIEETLTDEVKSKNPFIFQFTLDQEEAAELERENIPGIYAAPLRDRYGPQALARHIVGSVTGSVLQGSVEKGLNGIESFYNKELTPRESLVELGVVVNGRGEALKGGELLARGKKGAVAGGNDVVLTLDRDVQQAVENVLDEHTEKGAAVLIDIPSGEIRALASRPSYSYNQGFLQGEEFDRCFGLYHPGSVFKIAVAAAALAEGVVDADEKFNCNGKYVFQSGEEISCWKSEGHGELTFSEAFAHSCNSVFVETAMRLGSLTLEHYAQLLGLEKGIAGYSKEKGGVVQIGGLPGEVGNAALGQDGVTVSPVNLAALAAAIARGGIYRSPALVKSICGPHGEVVKEIESPPAQRVLPQHVAEEVQKMMELAVADGTGKKAQTPGLGSAGKTGSAETGRVDEQGEAVVDAWFVGYAPLEKPQLAVAVFVEGGGSGGDAAALIFKEIILALQSAI